MDAFDLRLLRTLVAIEERSSFAAAAVQLNLTQSAVTQQMQRLESQIGHPLFEKQGRQKRLSTHGQKLYGYARHILALNDDAMRSFQEGGLEGILRIGASHDVAETMLPPLLTQVARASPMLQLDIHTGRSPFLMESLKRGEIDMAISSRHDETLEGVVLRTSPTVWLCSANYVVDLNKPLPLILVEGPSIYHRLAREALDEAGIRWAPTYTTSSLIGVKAALRAGLGVTARGVEIVVPDIRVLGEADGVPRLPDVTYYLFIRKNVINPLTRQVYEFLKSNLGLIRNAAGTPPTFTDAPQSGAGGAR